MFIYEIYNHKYNKERFLGAYIHDLRNEYDISQKKLANIVHISNSSLSKMESGQQNMDLNTFNSAIQFFESYDPNYYFNRKISKLEEAEELIDKCLCEFINLSYSDKMNEFAYYLQNDEIKHSFAYFHYLIIKSFYNLFLENGSMKDIQHIINAQYFEGEYHLAILYDLLGIIEDIPDLNTIRYQISILKKARSFAQSIDCNALLGLIEYHLTYRYGDLNKPLHALDFIPSCIHNLQQSGAYRRILTVQMNEGILYKNLHLYTKAITIYENLVNNFSQINDPKIQSEIFDNLAWCEFMRSDHEKALEYGFTSLKMGSVFPDLYVVLAFSSYKTGKYIQSQKYAQKFINKKALGKRAKFIKLFMSLLLAKIENKSEICNLEQQIISLLPQFRSVELEIPLYSLLIDYYHDHNNSDKVIEYQDLLIQYLLNGLNNL